MFFPIHRESPLVTNAFFVLTKQCNLRCKYCYETHTNERMSKEVAFDALEYLFRNGLKSPSKEINITFFGGEPTLEAELIVHILEQSSILCDKTGVKAQFSMITNCTSLPQIMEDVFIRFNDKFRFSIQLSVDGPQEIQDAYRVLPNGNGSWYKVEPIIKRWKDLHDKKLIASIGVHGCINKSTISRVFDIYNFFRYGIGIQRVWLMPIPESDWTEEDVVTYDHQCKIIYDSVTKHCLEDKNFVEIRNFAPFDRAISKDKKRGLPCGAGVVFATVLPNGDLAACHQLGFHSDSIPIGDIWSGIDDNKRRIFTEYEDEDMGCEDCPHQSCYRCIASNFDNSQSLFMKNGDMQCKLMLVDWKYQEMLKTFIGVNHNEFSKKNI